MDYVIKNGEVIDPETKKREILNIGIGNGKILNITNNPINAEKEIDAEGLTVVPGFIDIHIHEDPFENDTINFYTEECMLRMGVTTVVGGNCGFSPISISKYFKYIDKNGAPVNTLMFLGYSAVRSTLTMHDRGNTSAYRLGNVFQELSDDEINKLKPLIKKSVEEGALGLSFGFEYTPGTTTDEVIKICEALKNYDKAMIASHYRYDMDRCFESIEESILIAKETKIPYQFSHIGSCSAFGYMEKSLEMIDEAKRKGVDITTDCYPYAAFSTLVGSAVFDEGCFEKWKADYSAVLATEGKYKNQRCTKEIFEYLRENEPDTRVVCFVMNEDDVYKAYKHPDIMVASDGKIKKGQGHPRGAGTFPRVLGKLARDKKILSFEDAINKMTLLPAKRLGFKTKGRIQEGCDADITILNREIISDNATYTDPALAPSGIEYVFVNGELALKKGAIVNKKAGKSIRRQDVK